MRPSRNVLAVLAASLAAFAAALALNFGFWWFQGRPQNIPDARGTRIKSASFSPYRRGQSPFGETFTPRQLDEDMAVAAKYFTRIRVYSSTGPFADVPRLARKYGLKVILGAWIGASLPDNEEEIAAAIKAANEYPDTVERVVVGNEALLRDEVTPGLLISYIRRVKAAVKQPVTYADVWEYWLLHPEVAREVDSITIHVLPYWEDKPTPLSGGVAHMLQAVDAARRAYPDKPVLIGEIGWPSAGRVREGSVPSRVAQASFVRQIMNAAAEHGFDYNVFELFDEPWKAAQEGTVGAHWGMLDADRHMKFPLTGPVSDKPYWFAAFCLSGGLGALLALLALCLRRPATALSGARLMLAAQLFATLLAASAEQSLGLAFDVMGVLTGVFYTGCGALLCLLVFSELADQAAGRIAGPKPLSPVVARLAALRAGRLCIFKTRAGLVGLLDLTLATATLSQAVGLVIDPRYRDFRVAQLLPAAVCLILRLLAARERQKPVGSAREEWLFCAVFILCALVTPPLETLRNPAALAWGGTLLLLAVPWVVSILNQRRAVATGLAQ